MKRVLSLVLLITAVASTSLAQKVDFTLPDSAKVSIEPDKFNYALLEEILLVRINEQRHNKNLGILKEIYILKRTAYDQASYMSSYNTLEQDDAGERAILYGGTRNVTELVARTSLGGVDKVTYKQGADAILERLISNTSSATIVTGPMYKFTGISATIDAEGKWLYVSADFGNDNSIAPRLDANAATYISQKSFELEPFNAKTCNKCDKIEHVNELASGITIEKNNIYFSCDNIKRIKQLMKTANDGFAADIVSKNQFRCGRDNIINYNSPNKGIILKPIFFEDVLNKNLEDQKSGRFKMKLGEVPKGISPDSIEVNLIIIQQNRVCKSLYKPHIVPLQGPHNFTPSMRLLKDPKFQNDKPMTLDAADKAYRDRMCSRSSNTMQADAANIYNCVCATYSLNLLNTESNVNQVYLNIEKSKTIGKVNLDSLSTLEIAVLIKTSQTAAVSELMRQNAANRLKEIEPRWISVDNNIALYAYFAGIEDYARALSWLDLVILSPGIPEDVIFSYISLSALSSARVNSGLLTGVIELAKKVNQDRFCELFSPGGLSFQVMENQAIKGIVCQTCTK